MKDLFSIVLLPYAAVAALMRFLEDVAASAAFPFSVLSPVYLQIARVFLPQVKKIFQKFNFFETFNLYYNIVVMEFAIKAKVFSFCQINFEGEEKIYFMRKIQALFCAIFLFTTFLFSAQDEPVYQLEKYSRALKSEKAKDRLEAIYSLSLSSQPESERMLIEAYELEKDAYLKTQILESLSVKNSTSALNFIFKATEDPNIEIRKTAWNCLNEQILSVAGMAAKVRENFAKEKNVSVKANAMRVLCLDSSDETLKEISSFISDSKQDKWLRKMALRKLAFKKSKSARKQLYSISKIKDREIALEAARLLNEK